MRKQVWEVGGLFQKVNSLTKYNTAQANMTITSAGWSTFIAPFSIKIPDGVTAYIITDVKGEQLVKTKLIDTIPANTPVLLEGNPINKIFIGTNTSTKHFYGEVLVGNVSGAVQSVPQGSYVLQKNGDKLGFFYVNDNAATISNNRCYLKLDKNIGSVPL